MKTGIPTFMVVLLGSIFIPIRFKGDGRLWGFLLSVSFLYLFGFVIQLNPVLCFSTNSPYIEDQSNLQLVLYSAAEFVLLNALAVLYLWFGYFLVEMNDYNTQVYINASVDNRQRTAEYFAIVCLFPAMMLSFWALFTCIVRVVRRGDRFYTEELRDNFKHLVN